MISKALFLQKPELLEDQLPELEGLFGAYLPQFEPHFAGSPEDVPAGACFELIVTSFLPFLPEVLARVQKPAHLHFTSSGMDRLSELAQQADLGGVRITSSAGVNAVSIAEHVAGCILTFAKNLHLYRDQQRQGVWKRYWHQEIRGERVCVIGMGEIGRAVAKRCRALEMRVTGCVRNLRHCPEADDLILTQNLTAELHRFSYVVLCLPLTPETKGFFGEDCFRRMKPESVLINVARGGLADEAALLRALTDQRIKGAALDVFEDEPLPQHHPFWETENLLLTPHVAGTTQHYLRNMFEILANHLKM